MKASLLLIALCCLPLSGCALFGHTTKVKVEHPLITLESGLQYQELMLGQGPPAERGQTVTVDYVGFLSDGTVFDSSRKRGVPMNFELGAAPLVGWNEGILGMQAGGERRLSLPPELAYGSAGVEGIIPPDETLVFDISLLKIEE